MEVLFLARGEAQLLCLFIKLFCAGYHLWQVHCVGIYLESRNSLKIIRAPCQMFEKPLWISDSHALKNIKFRVAATGPFKAHQWLLQLLIFFYYYFIVSFMLIVEKCKKS